MPGMTTPDPASPSTPVIGLLGAPGSGKSQVARALAKLGAAVIDADALAREALDRPDVRGTITQWWGPGVLRPDGSIDRAAVGQRVFDNPAELARLESLIHPLVNARRAELRGLYRQDPAVTAIVEDCPLLLERELDGDCDVLVYVDAPEHVRLERVARTRGWTAQELQRREKNQLPLDIKRRRADYVVDNGSDTTDLLPQTQSLLHWVSPRRA